MVRKSAAGLGALSLFLVLAGGCASVHESHYFRSQSGVDQPNYYRVTIDAKGRATKVRYLSGYFDQQAVEQYFSEFAQPANVDIIVGKNAVEGGGESGEGKGSGSTLQPIDPKLEDRSLVLILSTNVDEIAAQIGGLAENLQVQAALTGLAKGDEAKEGKRAQKKRELDEIRAQQLTATIVQVKESLASADATDAAKLLAARLRAINALATYLGSTASFEDIKTAEDWLDANRLRIHAELGN